MALIPHNGTGAVTRFRTDRPRSSTLGRMLQHGDIPFKTVITLAALTILGLMIGVGVMLWIASSETRSTVGFNFITSNDWNPVGEQFGALPFIAGTLVTSLVALVVAVPLGLGIAVFLAELCPAR